MGTRLKAESMSALNNAMGACMQPNDNHECQGAAIYPAFVLDLIRRMLSTSKSSLSLVSFSEAIVQPFTPAN